MSDLQLIRYCAPTLAGLKAGSLFNAAGSRAEADRVIARWNGLTGPKGVWARCLCRRGERTLIYVYRLEALCAQLSGRGVRRFLAHYGYPADAAADPERTIAHLTARLRSEAHFPHEIGLFLGYPLEDVAGFVAHRGRRCKCVGCWKVYGDAVFAQKRFQIYKSCTRHFCRSYRSGFTVDRLTVARFTP
jgi:hypothetical protein